MNIAFIYLEIIICWMKGLLFIKKKMNSELDIVTDQLLHHLNDTISEMQTQDRTLENEMKAFQKLHDLHYDIRYARASNSSSMDPSIKVKKDLKAIYAYLMLILEQLRDRQKKSLLSTYNEQMTEELKHPQVDTPQKMKLKTYFSHITLFIQRIDLLFT